MCLSGKGLPKKPVDLQTALKKIQKNDIRNLEAIELYTTIPNYQQLAFGWQVTAQMHISSGTFVFSFEESLLNEPAKGFLLELLRDILPVYDYQYGISYIRDREFGPVLYAFGMSAGLGYDAESLAKGDQISQWFHRKNELRSGKIRDVYPINILSEHQRAYILNSQTLESWIKTKGSRGRIELFDAKRALWTIDPADIQNVRKELAKSGILICCNKQAD